MATLAIEYEIEHVNGARGCVRRSAETIAEIPAARAFMKRNASVRSVDIFRIDIWGHRDRVAFIPRAAVNVADIWQ